jgi:flagellar protein FliO/FliZ
MSAAMRAAFFSGSARVRIVLALGLLLGLAVVAQARQASWPSMARGVLGGLALMGGAGWWLRQERRGARFQVEQPLRVVSRMGLSPRCGVALVEVEGSRYLVAYGDSFAEIRRTRTRACVPPRRSLS